MKNSVKLLSLMLLLTMIMTMIPIASAGATTVKNIDNYASVSSGQTVGENQEVESIEVTKVPNKKFIVNTKYYIGWPSDFFYGMELNVTYSDGTNKVYFEYGLMEIFSGLKFSGNCITSEDRYNFFVPALGENVITVTYGGKSADFTITGLGVESLEVTSLPANKFVSGVEYGIYYIYDGMEVKVTYSDATSELYNYEDNMNFFRAYELTLSGYRIYDYSFTPALGNNVITLTCGGKSTDFTITGLGVESLEVTSLPVNKFFADTNTFGGDIYDGMEVKVTYSDGTSELYHDNDDGWDRLSFLEFSADCIDEYGNFYFTPGENVITVSYGGKSTNFTITAIGVESLEVTSLPVNKFLPDTFYDMSYIYDGMEVKVTYTDGTSELYNYEDNWDIFSMFEFSGDCIEFNFDEGGFYFYFSPGNNVITMSYGGKSTDFTIITGVESLEVTSLPDNEFVAGVEYNIYDIYYGMEVKVTYTDGTSELYSYDNDNWDIFSMLEFSGDCVDFDIDGVCFYFTPGNNVITVSYGGKSTDFTIITPPVVESLEVTSLPAIEFVDVCEYDINALYYGMEIKVTYTDGTSELYNYEDNWDIFSMLEFSGDNIVEGRFLPVLGENVIVVTYGGKSAEFTVTGVTATGKISGDVDGDGELMIKDATYIQLYLANLIGEDELNLDVADFDNDGDINVKDVTFIQMKLANLL